MCRAHGARVVLIRYPCSYAELEHCTPEYLERVDAIFDRLAKKHGAERWDCLDFFADAEDEVLYHNRTHLNQAGAKLFGKHVEQRLLELAPPGN